MAHTILIVWTFVTAAVTFLFGIWAAVSPYGAIWVGLMFVLSGLGLGGGMAFHLYKQRPQTSQSPRAVRRPGSIEQQMARASTTKPLPPRGSKRNTTTKQPARHQREQDQMRKVRVKSHKDPRITQRTTVRQQSTRERMKQGIRKLENTLPSYPGNKQRNLIERIT